MEERNKKKESKESDITNHSFIKKIQEKHHEDLGLRIPEGYFFESKNELLEKTIYKKSKKLTLFSRKTMVWSAAAAIICIVLLTVNEKKSIHDVTNNTPVTTLLDSTEVLNDETLTNLGLTSDENDVLIASLFIEDSDVDEFIESYVLEEVFNDEIPFN